MNSPIQELMAEWKHATPAFSPPPARAGAASSGACSPEVKVEPGKALWHAYAVDIEAGKKLMPELMKAYQEGKLSLDEVKKLADQAQKRFSDFSVPIAEEQPVTKHFELAGTPLKLSVTAMFTDETMPVAVNSFWMGVVLGTETVPNAITAPGASIAETSFTLDTYKLLAKTRRRTGEQLWVVGAECQLASDREWLNRQNKAAGAK